MRVEVDTDTPNDVALLLDNGSETVFQHGGVATKITFDKVTVEPVDQLLQRGIDKADDKVTLVRMEHDKKAYLITPDSAITYEGCRFQDLPLDQVAACIKTTESREFIPDVPYPIVAYIENVKKSFKQITVALNNYSFEFVDQQLGITDPVRLYMPPLWFGVEINGENIGNLHVAVIPQYNGNAKETEIFKLPLPNIFADGHICMGRSRISGMIGDTKSDGALLTNSMTRFFCSNWNSDLTGGNEGVATETSVNKLQAYNEDLHTFFMKLLRKGVYEDRINTLKCIASLARPNGWTDMQFRPLYGTTTKEFLGCGK